MFRNLDLMEEHETYTSNLPNTTYLTFNFANFTVDELRFLRYEKISKISYHLRSSKVVYVTTRKLITEVNLFTFLQDALLNTISFISSASVQTNNTLLCGIHLISFPH